jgi:hypothetical protein
MSNYLLNQVMDEYPRMAKKIWETAKKRRVKNAEAKKEMCDLIELT